MNLITSFFKKNKIPDMKFDQLKLDVYHTYKKDENFTTNFEAVNDEDVINKGFSDTKISKIEGQISYIGKSYHEFELHNKEDLQFERAVRTTKEILYDKGLFDIYDNADQIIKDYLLVEVNDRRRPDLGQSK